MRSSAEEGIPDSDSTAVNRTTAIACAVAWASATSRRAVLPIPGSPLMRSTVAWSWRARRSASPIRSISPSRPTSMRRP